MTDCLHEAGWSLTWQLRTLSRNPAAKSRADSPMVSGIQNNIEIKARISDFEKCCRIAAEIAGGAPQVLNQIDTYFFVRKGRLKLREDESGNELIYYERPDVGEPKRSDYERYLLESPEAIKRILDSALGVRVVVRKQRLVYIRENVRIHLDKVEGLGHFLELEAVVDMNTDIMECTSRVNELLGRFEVKDSEIVALSYSDLLENLDRV